MAARVTACIIFMLCCTNVFALDRVVGIADIVPLVSDLHPETAICCVKPKVYKSIEAGSYSTGNYKKAFTIDFDSLPEMLPFGYSHDYAAVYAYDGGTGNLTIRKGNLFAQLSPRNYRQYLGYPEFLSFGSIKNVHVDKLFKLTDDSFVEFKSISKKNGIVYKGYIVHNEEKWIRVDIYDQSECGESKNKFLYSGWVKAYFKDQPSLWVFPRGC